MLLTLLWQKIEPATLMVNSGKNLSAQERDIERAKNFKRGSFIENKQLIHYPQGKGDEFYVSVPKGFLQKKANKALNQLYFRFRMTIITFYNIYASRHSISLSDFF